MPTSGMQPKLTVVYALSYRKGSRVLIVLHLSSESKMSLYSRSNMLLSVRVFKIFC